MTQPCAELIGRHACALALVELGRDDEASAHLGEAQRITRGLEAWRFEGENLMQIVEIHLKGRRFIEARAAIETAIRIASETAKSHISGPSWKTAAPLFSSAVDECEAARSRVEG